MKFFSFRSVTILLLLLLPSIAKAQQVDDEAQHRKLSYFYMAAQRAKAQGKYAEMLELLNHCRDIVPNDPATVFGLGEFCFPLGKDSVGTAMIEQAVAADPNNPWYLERLASVYLDQNKREKALGVLEKMSALQTKRVDVLTQLFMLYKQMGRTEDVIKTLDRIQTLQGNNIRIAEQKYQLYRDMDRLDEGLEQIRSLCRETPYDVSCHLVLADHYLENDMMDSARVCMDRAEQLDPQNSGLQLMRLQSILQIGDTLQYESKRNALILDKQADMQVRFTALREIAISALQDSTKREPARQLFEALLTDEDADVVFLQLYKSYDTFLHQDSANYVNLPLLERILKVDPANYEATTELVQYYIGLNDGKNLQRVCQDALVYFPTEVRFHYFLALTYLQDKQDKEAEETIKAGIRQANEETAPEILGTLYTLLGDLCHSQKREKEAFEAYDSCLVYSPDDASCLNNYAYYLSLKGEQLDKAEKMSYRAVRLQPGNKTYLDTYAWVLFMQEDYTTARMYMDKVVNPELADSLLLGDDEVNAVLLEHAGDIYALCEQPERALRLWALAQEKAQMAKEQPNKVLRKKLRKKKFLKK